MNVFAYVYVHTCEFLYTFALMHVGISIWRPQIDDKYRPLSLFYPITQGNFFQSNLGLTDNQLGLILLASLLWGCPVSTF